MFIDYKNLYKLYNYKKIYNPRVSFRFMVQDTSEIKEKIISVLKSRGPSLPVHIAGEIKTSILFSSAFLSELLSEKRIKISHMRIGSSPLYFLSGQELFLEKSSQYLKSKEKDAFLLLREKKFLKDREQSPAIRVALREIRDFAIPFKDREEVVWRYFLVPESEFKITEEKPAVAEIKKPFSVKRGIEKPLDIFGEKEKPEIKPKKKKAQREKTSKKENEFFDNIKEFLSGNSIDLLDIEDFGKREIILKVREKGEEKILIAYNKNKISEDDIIKASKKASKENLPYIILGLGGPLKKLDRLIEALKGLSSIEKMK